MALKEFLMIWAVAAVLAACGDDNSSNSTSISDEETSSSVCEDCDDLSSSSGVITSDASQSSDSKSSSSNNGGSGASVGMTSSSVKISFSDGSSSSSVTSSSSVASSSSEQSSSSVAYVDPSTVVSGTMIDERDGKTYKTVTIGTQTWMAENLNYETDSSFCYNESVEYCAKYGRLYIWDATLNACPDGWHLPDMTEWSTLFSAVGGKSTAGKMLKSTSGWNINGNGTDDYAFTVLSGGGRDSKPGSFYSESRAATFWSSTEGGRSYAYSIGLNYNTTAAKLISSVKHFAFSVRCMKGEALVISSNSSSSVTLKSSSSYVVPEGYVEPSTVVTGTMTDERDGQTYKTITIGTQTWMAENLNYAYIGVPYDYKSNDTVNDKVQTSDSISWCYNDSAEYCTKYGRLYTWAAAMDSVGTWSTNGKGCGYDTICSPIYPVRGICPSGWHLPTNDEFDTLQIAVGGIKIAGSMLKSTNGWRNFYTGEDENNGTDAYSFAALPAGYFMGHFVVEGKEASFWTSSEYDIILFSSEELRFYSYDWRLFSEYSSMGSERTARNSALSVRCVKD